MLNYLEEMTIVSNLLKKISNRLNKIEIRLEFQRLQWSNLLKLKK